MAEKMRITGATIGESGDVAGVTGVWDLYDDRP